MTIPSWVKPGIWGVVLGAAVVGRTLLGIRLDELRSRKAVG